MTFAIAAAGTGGHVYPGLAVGEALVERGVARDNILFVGGERLEATACPQAGFPFLPVELRGLERRLTLKNLGIPSVVNRARQRIRAELERRGVSVLLGLGGYVTVPAGLAASGAGVRFAVSEQNASAGLANRVMARRAERVFGSFPVTDGLPSAEWVGNPLRRSLAEFDRDQLRPVALERWGFDPSEPVLGVFGGSLGAGVLNQAVAALAASWSGSPLQILHLAGHGAAEVESQAAVSGHRWKVVDFTTEMDKFYAACDLVVARAGGSVAELTATGTPSILVPGGFGSGGHQAANAAALGAAGAAVVVEEAQVGDLSGLVADLLGDPGRRAEMVSASAVLARPDAADTIAAAMVEMGESA